MVKIFLTIITFGIKVPAGILYVFLTKNSIPSMTIGASFGRIIGMIIEACQQNYPTFWLFASCQDSRCVTPGTYAMVGAAAFLAGVTRMTVSLTVIMFELTGAFSYILPIMLTVMVANLVGNALDKRGYLNI
jgi:chloride channel 3/4/5